MHQAHHQAARPVFRVALSMSGAISAGAYTAGVFDFLVQALWELDQARKRTPDDPSLPGHDVAIVGMAGASAGGITAALGAIALGYAQQEGLGLTQVPTESGGSLPCMLPRLYNAWVQSPRMVGLTDTAPCLLSTEDLAGDALVSLLNGAVLDKIRDDALAPRSGPKSNSATPFTWLAEPLHVYLTVSNLNGVQYDVKGDDSADAYHMVNHADRQHFRISGLGSNTRATSDWAGCDSAIAMNVDALLETAGTAAPWRMLGQGALATAAFPVGLEARLLQVERADYQRRLFPAPDFPGAAINPAWPASQMAGVSYDFVSVDGGVINNDPFEIARFMLLDDWRNPRARNPRDPAQAECAVIMISPFPEGAQVPGMADLDARLVRVITSLLPTLMQQVRFKLDELAAAASPKVASRMLIAPRKTGQASGPSSSANIACGALGGFGGFLAQSFREHDFQLGRRNCQDFLKGWTQSKFTTAQQTPILPLFGSARETVAVPVTMPMMARADCAILLRRIRQRANALVPVVLRGHVKWWLWRFLIRCAWVLHFRGLLMDRIAKVITDDLTARGQLQPDRRRRDP